MFSATKRIHEKNNCQNYQNGELNEYHKKVFKRIGKQYPFTEMR